MKLHCHRSSLAAALQIVGGVVPSRTPQDILKNVKLVASKDSAMLIGTDQEVGIRFEIAGVEVATPGETLLPTAKVQQILREATGDALDIEVNEGGVRLGCGQAEFKLAAADAAEFPNVAAFEDKAYFVLEGGPLQEAIKRTIFATDDESTRYALGGIKLELADGDVTLAATDSRRLAVVATRGRVEGSPEVGTPDPVVPSKAMQLVERSITEDDQEVHVAIHQNHALFRVGNSTIFSRLVEGRFPRYRDVIPNRHEAEIELTVGPFHSVVRQSQIVTNEESRGVDFDFGDGQLVLKSVAADVGESKIELPIGYSGKNIGITFDPRYIADFLRVLEPERVLRMHLIDSESPAVFRTDDGYTYVAMPLSRER
jgi:DNA polymerase III subunit beta